MTEKKNKQITKEYIDKIIKAVDVSTISNYLSPGYTEVHNNMRETSGIEEVKKKDARHSEHLP